MLYLTFLVFVSKQSILIFDWLIVALEKKKYKMIPCFLTNKKHLKMANDSLCVVLIEKVKHILSHKGTLEFSSKMCVC